MSQLKVGLVLSGGGAKGAYQVGVLKALHELGADIGAVAGASIGALNAAILASAPSFKVGIERMETLWSTLAESSPLSANFPAYLKLLLASGLKLNGQDYLLGLIHRARSFGARVPPVFDEFEHGLLSDYPLRQLMDQYFDVEALRKGLPLYVSVFRSQGALSDVLRTFAAELGVVDTPESEFLHIQTLPDAEQKEALLASAAIPLLFAPKRVHESPYSDGGMGGWQKLQGNTPITPLLQAGFKMVIVTHLSDGSLWSRQDFPDATVIEIRPQSPIERSGGVRDLLGFDPNKIPSWIEQGYVDTKHCVGRVMESVQSRNELRQSESALMGSERAFTTSEPILEDALARLRSIR